MTRAAMSKAAIGNVAMEEALCAHCAQPLGTGRWAPYCCLGCRSVSRLLSSSGLERYYDLRRGAGVPVQSPPSTPVDRSWLEPFEAQLAEGASAVRVDLGIQGVHCSACVWLVQTLFEREGYAGRAIVNPALGRVELLVPSDFPLRDFVAHVEDFGYRLGPAEAVEASATRDADGMLLRAVFCLVLAVNSMMYAAAIYLGLEEGPLHTWLTRLSFAAATLSVIVGGPVFFRSAWEAMRRGMLHLDVPISLGLGLAFLGSAYSYFFGDGRSAYVDTVTAFIALMLLGRWLQQRMVDRNRRELLRDPGLGGLKSRRLEGGVPVLVASASLERGDHVRIVPGDFVPVAGSIIEGAAECSLTFIDGESTPRSFAVGADIPAGAFNVGDKAFTIAAKEGFSASDVARLLSATRTSDDAKDAPFWQRIGGPYVVLVLSSALAAFLLHFRWGESPVAALEVTTAVLVVTCPCAFGIALPLAYERMVTELRRVGVFVRESSFFGRALGVRSVVFDKTGTLTTGRLRLADEAALDALDEGSRSALYAMVARSGHPKAMAVLDALSHGGGSFEDVPAEAHEVAGAGIVLLRDGREHRLGAPGWAAPSKAGDLVYGVDGVFVAAFETLEDIRPAAAEELSRLRQDYELYILSGDQPARVAAMAEALDLPAERALGGCDPEAKARFIESLPPNQVLMVGDGLNDAPAFAAAHASATPSVDRPFMAARCDFYFLTPGLEAVAQALRGAQQLAKTVRLNLAFAVTYNAFAVSLALAGHMRPWVAAILMPASSLFSIALTLWLTRPRRDAWTS